MYNAYNLLTDMFYKYCLPVCRLTFYFLGIVFQIVYIFSFEIELTNILLWIVFLVLYLGSLCLIQGHKYLLCFFLFCFLEVL